MTDLFYVSGMIAIIAALLVVTQKNAAHAVVYLVILFLAIASVFLTLGGPLVAALQIVIYAGAIIVLFVFVVMMLNEGRAAEERERARMPARIWIVPVILGLVLISQIAAVVFSRSVGSTGATVEPKQVGILLFTRYLAGVELASMLLLAALAAAFHFGAFTREDQAGG
jgi:NADH-quinone oxidoreductase subunit J